MLGDRLETNTRAPKPGSLAEAIVLMKGTTGSFDLIPILTEIEKNKVRTELLERKLFDEYGVEDWVSFFSAATKNSSRISIKLRSYLGQKNEAVAIETIEGIIGDLRY